MATINLAQESVRNQLMLRRRRTLYVLALFVLSIVGGAYGLLLFLTSRTQGQIDTVEAEVGRLEQRLNARKDDVQEIVLFRDRLKILRTVLGQRPQWSRFFDEIERLMLSSVQVSALTVARQEKTFSIDALVPTLDAAADLIVSFQNAKGNPTSFAHVEVEGLKAVENIVASVSQFGGYTVTIKAELSSERLVQPETSPGPVPGSSPSPSPSSL